MDNILLSQSEIGSIGQEIDKNNQETIAILHAIYADHPEKPHKLQFQSPREWQIHTSQLDILIENYKHQKEERDRQILMTEAALSSANAAKDSAKAAQDSASVAQRQHRWQKISIVFTIIFSAVALTLSIVSYIDSKKSQRELKDFSNRVTIIEQQSNPTPPTP